VTLPGPLVSGAWLAANLDAVRIVDVRWYLRPTDGRTGAVAFAESHLSGAVFLDLDTELCAPAGPAAGRHPLPDPSAFAAALGRAGIASGTPVVCYDDAGGSVAARLWWMLQALGEPAAVLDGGLAGWPGELTSDVAPVTPVVRAAQPWPAGFFVTADEVADCGATLLDARAAERYAAGDPDIDPRPGHIPGARSAPWAGNLDERGRFLPADQLRALYSALGVGATGAVAYCGSGVTACHDLLALRVAGIGGLALYPGSWSQWGADPGRSAETGPDELFS
jgi:thiosulfate/3-mercaptopyruvate sulfurtransferase